MRLKTGDVLSIPAGTIHSAGNVGSGTVTSYSYDPASRPTSLTQDLAGTAQDQTLGFAYNPAAQITSTTRSNDSYAFTQNYSVTRPYTVNGLNQYGSAGQVSRGGPGIPDKGISGLPA